jgi:hypothetical protein
MSADVTPETPRPAAESSYDDWYHDRGSGWTSFAGVLLLIVETLNVIEGIAAIGNARCSRWAFLRSTA